VLGTLISAGTLSAGTISLTSSLTAYSMNTNALTVNVSFSTPSVAITVGGYSTARQFDSGFVASGTANGTFIAFHFGFTNTPQVTATMNASNQDIFSVTVYNVTTTGFYAKCFVWDGANIGAMAGNFSWIALG